MRAAVPAPIVSALIVAASLGVALSSTWPVRAQTPRTTVTLHPPAIDDMVAIRLEVALDGQRVGVMAARKADVREEPTIRFALPDGFHRYAFAGHAERTGGRRDAIQGSGVIVGREYLTGVLESAAARRDPLAALDGLIAAHRAVAGAAERLPRLERASAKAGAAEIAAAERRLGIRLAPAYRTLLDTYGPFTYLEPGDDGDEAVGAALYAPDAVHAVPEWRRRVRKAPLDEGDTPRAKRRVASLARDAVIATTFDTGWTVRAGSHPPCKDGSPSVSGEFIFETRPGEDLWNDDTDHHSTYFDDVEPRCGAFADRIRDNFTAAFVAGFEKRTAVPRNGALRPSHDEDPSRPRVVRLFFGEY